MAICGLDFGTSNTTLGTFAGGAPVLATLEDGHTTIPSSIFYERGGAVLIGRRAIAAYVDGEPGRLMRSLKSVLGTALVDETTRTGRERKSFRDVIAYYLGAVKRRAEQSLGQELHSVVHGRPVHFVDGSPEADRKAEQTLRDIAHGIGFKDVTYQFEPIAAALDYERQIVKEEIALIADIGGGTSDFSIVRLSPQRHLKADRAADILATDGVRIGGTDFDRQLSLGLVMPLFGFGSAMKRKGVSAPPGYFHNLATWSTINSMYEPKAINQVKQARYDSAHPDLFDRLLRVLEEQRGHSIALEVETAKIGLSDQKETSLPFDWVEPGLLVGIKRPDLVKHTKTLASRIAERITICLEQAGLGADDIDAIFLTGGSVRLAHVREAIVKAAPAARIVEGDTFGAVGKGLTIEAIRRYGEAAAQAAE